MKTQDTSIAIAPFQNLSSDPNTEYFGIGFVEDLTTNLARFSTLRVISTQSMFGLKENGINLEEAASDWDLDFVLEGNVRRSPTDLRVNVKLVRIEDRQVIWAERFNALIEDIFDVQDEIVATVAGRLAVFVEDSWLENAKQRDPKNLQAYDCWLQGVECLNRGTLDGDEESRTFFNKALDIDPGYARAYSGLSLSHFNEWTCQAWHLWDESESNAFDYAMKAAELDKSDAKIQSILARVFRWRRQHEMADEHSERALSLNSNDSQVLIQIAIAKLFGGLHKEGLLLAQKAIRLNPLYSKLYPGIVGWNFFMLEKYDSAIGYLESAGSSVVNFGAYRAACAVLQGDLDRARFEYDRFVLDYQNKIAFGRLPAPGEALEWAVQVEPFRRKKDSCHMPDILCHAGFADVDVASALRSRPQKMVRSAGIQLGEMSNSFIRENGIWKLAYQGIGAQLAELKGFYDIAKLLAQCERPLHCLELSGLPVATEASHEMIDSEARKQYRQSIEELQHELEVAQSNNDPARSESVQYELDMLIEELTKATGLGGRSRQMGNRADRARSTVTWRIRSAIKKISVAHPKLGSHLKNSIRTGFFCVYSPELPTRWEL